MHQGDYETFRMVLQRLAENDPLSEKSIQPALQQNLHEMSEQCGEELRQLSEGNDTS